MTSSAEPNGATVTGWLTGHLCQREFYPCPAIRLPCGSGLLRPGLSTRAHSVAVRYQEPSATSCSCQEGYKRSSNTSRYLHPSRQRPRSLHTHSPNCRETHKAPLASAVRNSGSPTLRSADFLLHRRSAPTTPKSLDHLAWWAQTETHRLLVGLRRTEVPPVFWTGG